MGWRRLWKYNAWRQLPPSCLKTKTKTLLLKRLLLACFSMLLRQVYDNLGRSSDCDSSECDSSASSDPSFCCETLLQRAPGALTALPLPFRRFFATAAISASMTSKPSSNLTVLASVLLRTNEVACLPFTGWDMEYFHTLPTELHNKHFRFRLCWCSMVYVCR